MRISPGIRLLGLSAFAAAAVTAAQFFLNAGGKLYLICGLCLAAAALLDLAVSQARSKAFSIELPDLIRASRNKPLTLETGVICSIPNLTHIKIGFSLPKSWFAKNRERQVTLTGKTTRIPWPLTPLKQGIFHVESCHVQVLSRLGLWEITKRLPVQCRINVYPDMSRERKQMAALFTKNGAGLHLVRHIGKGREFDHLREYLPGDLYEDIHWKATARKGIPVTKIFRIEKTQDLYVMIDASRLSARDTTRFSAPVKQNSGPIDTLGGTILEKFITTALSIGLAARQQGDNFGIGVFTDKMETFIKAGGRSSHYNLCRDALFALKSRPVTPDFNEWITFTGNTLRKRALLIVLTCLDDPAVAENLADHIHILSRRHLVMVNMLSPVSTRPLFSSEKVQSADDIYSHLGGHLQWQFLQGFEKNLGRMGVGFHCHSSPDLTAGVISRYLDIKQRQTL